MGSWYSKFSKKMFMALASAGRFQTVCDCDEHERWRPGREYLADTLVTHINPNTSELSLFRAKGIESEEHKLDSKDDEPGKSIHWELMGSCTEIGFTPTPLNTPTPDLTPTPTREYLQNTPTPTPRFRCEDYEEWNPNKIINPGETHYMYKDRVYYMGKVYEVRDYHGTELNDIPGISNHWTYLFDCAECVCIPNHYSTYKVTDSINDFGDGVITTGFAGNLELGFDKSEFKSGDGVLFDLTLENSNIRGTLFIDKVDIPFSGVNIYAMFDNICYHIFAKSLNGNTNFKLRIKSFPNICPTPSPDSHYVCGDGFPIMYETDGKPGSHKPKYGLSAELFEPGGKLYYGDLQIKNLDQAMVYTSAVYKNEKSETPFGILVIVGAFYSDKNYVIYESPDGSCWRGNIQPNGKDIVMFRIL